eukprot:10848241-Prorocentrum_lima.AAC.1
MVKRKRERHSLSKASVAPTLIAALAARKLRCKFALALRLRGLLASILKPAIRAAASSSSLLEDHRPCLPSCPS